MCCGPGRRMSLLAPRARGTFPIRSGDDAPPDLLPAPGGGPEAGGGCGQACGVPERGCSAACRQSERVPWPGTGRGGRPAAAGPDPWRRRRSRCVAPERRRLKPSRQASVAPAEILFKELKDKREPALPSCRRHAQGAGGDLPARGTRAARVCALHTRQPEDAGGPAAQGAAPGSKRSPQGMSLPGSAELTQSKCPHCMAPKRLGPWSPAHLPACLDCLYGLPQRRASARA